MSDFPQRKPNRLKGYDYSADGSYFITICTNKHNCILWNNAGENIANLRDIQLSHYGKIVCETILSIEEHYPSVKVDNWAIMPNHIHLIITVDTFGGQAMPAPTVSTVIAQMKGAASKKAGISMWQKLFHDHIIRDEKEYRLIWNYIDNNPAEWTKDCFYSQN